MRSIALLRAWRHRAPRYNDPVKEEGKTIKRFVLAAVFCLASPLTFAQGPEVPKHKCEPRPEYPGRLALQRERDRQLFQRDINNYEECVKNFIEERKAVVSAQQTGVNAAIEEFNATMAAIKKEQEGNR